MKNLKGMTFGRLVVLYKADSRKSGIDNRSRAYWMCKCECGSMKEIQSDLLLRGETKSCGCLVVERIKNLNYTHGESNKTKECKTWSRMRSRCYSTTNPKYKNYGGRGITVCDRWNDSYENFLQDMGRCPDGHSIHRIDNDKGYYPENCKWATNNEQANCETTTVYLEHEGIRLSMVDWSRRLGYNYKAFHSKLRYQNKTLKELIDGSVHKSISRSVIK
jgi:hypothetical protein